LEGSARRFWLGGNGLQRKKTRKSEKVQKKVLFFLREPPVLLPKRPKNGLFFLSILRLDPSRAVLDVVGEEFTLVF
jgi:hypothetical protein